MAVFNGFLIEQGPTVFAGRCGSNIGGLVAEPSPSTTTYQYRVLATGVEGETTNPLAVPVGAVVTGIIYT